MNKFRVLAMACLANIAFAAGGDLWNFDGLIVSPNCGDYCSQVHTPGALFCWADAERPGPANGYGSPCYSKSGGWWFGYAENGGAVKDAVSNRDVFKPASCDPMPKDPTPAQSEGTIAIEKYISSTQNAAWKDIAVNPSSTAGHFFVKGYGMGDATQGLDVKFVNTTGTDMDPSISAIGFNWRQKEECGYEDYEGRFTEDLTQDGHTGLCIRYKADKAGVEVELGWNGNAYEYNTWIAKLPAASDWKTVSIKWESFGLSYQTDDPTEPIETALTKAEALKFALKTKGPAETVHFQLKEVGWRGSCSGNAEELPPYVAGGGGPNPIIGGKIASTYKFSLNGRMLSANFAAGTVQVVNLQGKIVAKKALEKGENLNLANVPVGVYMVRSENGIVQKIMVK